MTTALTIEGRYCGPPGSANGGYACGLLAGRLGNEALITLRSPPPLETPLEVRERDDGALHLRRGEQLIAEARAYTHAVQVPEPVSVGEAECATVGYPGAEDHRFPTCFVCGPDRAQGDGLRIFPGPVEGRDLVAAPWTPAPDLADEHGRVRDEFVWAALGCPSWFGAAASRPELRAGLLGQLAVRVVDSPRAGLRYVATGWVLRIEGRKARAGSALFGEDGRLVGLAQALWIRPRDG